jgi:hypothetical protein
MRAGLDRSDVEDGSLRIRRGRPRPRLTGGVGLAAIFDGRGGLERAGVGGGSAGCWRVVWSCSGSSADVELGGDELEVEFCLV